MNNADQQWKTSPIHPILAENEVHIWRASLNADKSVLSTLQRLLSDEEVTKAKQFYFDKDRQHFIVAHGILRMLLSRYLNISPNLLCFNYNVYGKPALSSPSCKSHLYFNLSHSQDMALYAFTYTRQIGVDVEYMRSDFNYEDLARQNFSAHEQITLSALPEALKQQAFFNCWTRKEAYIKARGKGLSLPLDLFDVSLQPGTPAMLLASREDSQETTRWSLQEFFPAPNYAGAVAVEGSGWHGKYWQWHNADELQK